MSLIKSISIAADSIIRSGTSKMFRVSSNLSKTFGKTVTKYLPKKFFSIHKKDQVLDGQIGE